MNDSVQHGNDADPNAISIADAQARIYAALSVITGTESVPAQRAKGRVLAENVMARTNVPPFRSSAMDGYAFRHIDGLIPLTVTGKSLAGHPGTDRLASGACHYITTGARVPDDADTVVMQENTRREGDLLHITQLPVNGYNVRAAGSDSQKNAVLMQAGVTVRAAEQGLLAAHGVTHIEVRRRLRVAVFSTGDELCEAGELLKPGQIYDTNRALLLSLLDQAAIELTDLGIRPDNIDALKKALDDAGNADLLISSGGVSVGDADHMRPVLDEHGHINLWKIAMKPGRPLAFGFTKPMQAWFGLPGNPVSSAVTCLLFVLPAIRRLLGQSAIELPAIKAKISSRLSKLPGRAEYQRGILHRNADDEWCVTTTGLQDSHVLTSLHKANCLVELAVDSTGAEPGDMVSTIPFAHLGEPIM